MATYKPPQAFASDSVIWSSEEWSKARGKSHSLAGSKSDSIPMSIPTDSVSLETLSTAISGQVL